MKYRLTDVDQWLLEEMSKDGWVIKDVVPGFPVSMKGRSTSRLLWEKEESLV